MKSLILFFLIAIGGSSGYLLFNRCLTNKCDLSMSQEFGQILRDSPPSEMELTPFCLNIFDFLDCYDNEIKNCTGQTFQELEASGNDTFVPEASFFNNLKLIITDLCNEDSEYRKNYVEIIECLKPKVKMAAGMCYQEAARLHEMYETSPPSSEEAHKKGMCLTKAFQMACTIKSLQESCGDVAKNVLLEAVRRLQLPKLSYCTGDNLITLRGDFVDFLEREGHQRDYYVSAFEF